MFRGLILLLLFLAFRQELNRR